MDLVIARPGMLFSVPQTRKGPILFPVPDTNCRIIPPAFDTRLASSCLHGFWSDDSSIAVHLLFSAIEPTTARESPMLPHIRLFPWINTVSKVDPEYFKSRSEFSIISTVFFIPELMDSSRV
jgi:hypothetical protein